MRLGSISWEVSIASITIHPYITEAKPCFGKLDFCLEQGTTYSLLQGRWLFRNSGRPWKEVWLDLATDLCNRYSGGLRRAIYWGDHQEENAKSTATQASTGYDFIYNGPVQQVFKVVGKVRLEFGI